jgi:hypothetical protein
MKLSQGEQESIVSLLTRLYLDICELETHFQFLVGQGDFRPRIEYFHDAIRAFTSKNSKEREAGGRLSVEILAYDLGCLRFLQSSPLASFKPHADVLSPHTDMIKLDGGLMPTNARPGHVERERLSELYQRYAVLFAALLKPFADSDFHHRIDDMNQDVGAIEMIIQQLKGKLNEGKLTDLAQHLHDEGLRQALIHFLQHKPYKKEEIKRLIQRLKDKSAGKDKDIAVVGKAHLDYAMAQLAIYEDAKDMVKKLAQQGMNLVGKFVESSIAETRREMGR